MSMLDKLAGIGSIATLVSGGNPAVAGLTTAVKAISAFVDKPEEKRTEEEKKIAGNLSKGELRKKLYMELAADLCRLSGSILDGLADGEITDEEQGEILDQLINLVQTGKGVM